MWACAQAVASALIARFVKVAVLRHFVKVAGLRRFSLADVTSAHNCSHKQHGAFSLGRLLKTEIQVCKAG